MKCFIIIGMPAAGKDIARQFARTKGYPYFATGDIVRAEAARREVSPDADSMARLSTELRGSDGLGVTRLALSTAVASGSAVVFMEGIRSKQEIDLIGVQAETVIVAFLAPRPLRRAGYCPGAARTTRWRPSTGGTGGRSTTVWPPPSRWPTNTF